KIAFGTNISLITGKPLSPIAIFRAFFALLMPHPRQRPGTEKPVRRARAYLSRGGCEAHFLPGFLAAGFAAGLAAAAFLAGAAAFFLAVFGSAAFAAVAERLDADRYMSQRRG